VITSGLPHLITKNQLVLGSRQLILSASRRTDIPAFYSKWFLNRLKEGYVLIRNPFNKKKIYKVSLRSKVLDLIVFWTKNPDNMLPLLREIDNFEVPYYFLFTVTSYGNELETNLPSKKRIIETFKRLSDFIGRERVIWRYDPILFTKEIDLDYHRQSFEFLAKNLKDYTDKCIISFIDLYKKCEKNLKDFKMVQITADIMIKTAGIIGQIAESCGIVVETCAEKIDLRDLGIKKGKCIDDKLISSLIGESCILRKDQYQRKECRCAESVDIGAYNTCLNFCLYCYANHNRQTVEKNAALHDPESPVLVGHIVKTDQIIERKIFSSIVRKKRVKM
jgi:hypothetical protein